MISPDRPPPTPAHENRAIYLAWAEFQRRQVSMAELADFDCVFLPMAYKGRNHLWRAWHYLLLALHTWRVLWQRRPHTVWLQLPQVPLLWVALLYRALVEGQVKLFADCHNAMFTPPWSRFPMGVAQLARCDLVLVHNEQVLAQALGQGVARERLSVLEDVPPLRWPVSGATSAPAARPSALWAGRPHPWVLFAGSYGRDEPIAELLQAARSLAGTVVITGRLGNAARNGHDISHLPPNVVLTDYLPVADFDALITHCDVVLALTRFDGIQLSVCNEALGFGKPMVVSDTPLLRSLFSQAGVMADSADPAAITAAINDAWARRDALSAASRALALQRRQHWQIGPLRDCLNRLQPLGHPVEGMAP